MYCIPFKCHTHFRSSRLETRWLIRSLVELSWILRAWFARLFGSCLDAFRNPVMAALVDGLPGLSDDDLTVDQDLVAVELCYERLASELSCGVRVLVASELSSCGGASD